MMTNTRFLKEKTGKISVSNQNFFERDKIRVKDSYNKQEQTQDNLIEYSNSPRGEQRHIEKKYYNLRDIINSGESGRINRATTDDAIENRNIMGANDVQIEDIVNGTI